MGNGVWEFLVRPEVWASLLGLAIFLALSWWLRGAPLGQRSEAEEGPDATDARTRDRAAIGSALGFMLVLAGGFAAIVYGVPWSLPLFVGGFATLSHLAKRYRPRRHTSPTLQRVVNFSEGGMNAALLGGVLIVANVLAFRYGGRPLDLTREGAFSLSSLTINQLRTLEKPVKFTVIASDIRMPRVLQLLELYRAEDPKHVTVERVDPYADPTGFEALAKAAPDLALNPRGGAIVVEYGSGETAERIVVRPAELFEVPSVDPTQPRPDQVESRFKGEDAITSALIRLREGTKPTVAITAGHGEGPIGQNDPAQPGLGLFVARLQSLGVNIVELPPDDQAIGKDVSVVIVAGPQTPFSPEDIGRLNRYMANGGKLLVFLDNRQDNGLGAFLKAYDVEVGEGLVVDPQLNYERRVTIIAAPILETDKHPIVTSLTNQLVLLASAAPLRIVAPSPGSTANASKYIVSDVLHSGPASWAETGPLNAALRRDEKDIPGPVTLAIAVAEKPQGGATEATPRLVVVGGRFVADNFFVAREPTNLDFVLNALNWLRGRPDLEGIAPKVHVSLTLTADPNLRAKLVIVPTLISIAVVMALGIATYLARRE
jgi:hypothetical protein